MISTSNMWNKVYDKTLLPETNVKITLDMTDPTIGDKATVIGYEEAEFSNSANMANVPVLYSNGENRDVFLEPNMWVLDGKGVITEDDYVATGYVCSEEYLGEDHLTITLSEPATTSIPGFTINWSVEQNEWATEFFVYVYKNGTRVAYVYVEDNDSPISVIDLPVSDYDEVVIAVEDWSQPLHRIRIEQVLFGYNLIFDKNQLLSYTHEQSGDPLSRELSSNSITFSIDNSDGKWDALNPVGLYKYLCEQQRLVVYYGTQCPLNDYTSRSQYEWIQAGVFYLTEWRAPSNGLEATFTAKDVFGLLNDRQAALYPKLTLTTFGDYSEDTPGEHSVYETYEDAKEQKNAVSTLSDRTEVTIYEIRTTVNYGRSDFPYWSAIYYAIRTEYGWLYAGLNGYLIKNYVHIVEADRFKSVIDSLNLEWDHDPYFYGGTWCPYIVDGMTCGEYAQIISNAENNAHWQDHTGRVQSLPLESTLSAYVIPNDKSYKYPEIELAKPIKEVVVKTHSPYEPDETADITVPLNDKGETVVVDNPFLATNSNDIATKLANKQNEWNRPVIKGEFQANPILELFDMISVEDKYHTFHKTLLTNIKYSYTGSFHCEYTGFIMD